MTSFLYLFVCLGLSALALHEQRTHNRAARLQAFFTLLMAAVTGGLFALIVSVAAKAGPAYDAVAGLGLLLLLAGSLSLVVRSARRFAAIARTDGLRQPVS